MYSCAHEAHRRKIPINPSACETLIKMHHFTANSFYKQTCEYACSIALMQFNTPYIETINRKVNSGLTPGVAAAPL